MKNLSSLFNPKSIAIVGASPKKEKLGNILLQNVKKGGWRGKVFCVNPNHRNVGGLKCHLDLKSIGKKIDLALIAVPAPLVAATIENGALASPKISNFAVISSGFKETGSEGKKREEELKTLAEKHNLNILGPNCLGFINPKAKLNASFTTGKFAPGKVAIVSQSGALAVALLDWTQNMSVGFSKVISIGNKAVLTEDDIIGYLAGDSETKAIALYLEDIAGGAEFISKIRSIDQNKPIIILKAGKNKLGQKAISSHTGSLAQDEAITSAVFEKLNVIEAENISEFQDLLLYLNSDAVPRQHAVIVVTNAGGPGVLSSDFIGRSKNLKLAALSAEFKKKIKKNLPDSASVENPIDIIGDAAPERYQKTLAALAQKFPGNPILVILTPQSQTAPDKVAEIIKNFKKKMPLITSAFMGGAKINQAIQYLQKNGVANFESPERALAVIEKLIRFSERKSGKDAAVKQKEITLHLEVNKIIQNALREKRKILYWNETEKIFRKYGVELTNSITLETIKKSALGKISYPAVLKTDDPKIVHRWDKKAVALGIQDEKTLKKEFKKMKRATGAGRFLVQSMAEKGLEIILGLKRDASFGPVIVCGWGGTMTEVFKDRVILIPPLTEKEIARKIQEMRIYPVLKGFRGERGYNVGEIAKIILALQNIAIESPDISEIDINPALIYNNRKRCQILDAKVYLAPQKRG